MRADEKYATYDACAYIVLPVIFKSGSAFYTQDMTGHILCMRWVLHFLHLCLVIIMTWIFAVISCKVFILPAAQGVCKYPTKSFTLDCS